MTAPVAPAARATLARRVELAEGAAHASAAMHVIARVGTERFAFRVADVEEVLDAPKLLAAPSGPEGLAGQVNHRERTVRAYDAAWVFGLGRSAGEATPAAPTTLVLRVADDRVALLVDDVENLASLPADAMRAPPQGTDPAGLLRGVCLPRAGGAGDPGDADALIGVVNVVAVVARASSLRGASVAVGGGGGRA